MKPLRRSSNDDCERVRETACGPCGGELSSSSSLSLSRMPDSTHSSSVTVVSSTSVMVMPCATSTGAPSSTNVNTLLGCVLWITGTSFTGETVSSAATVARLNALVGSGPVVSTPASPLDSPAPTALLWSQALNCSCTVPKKSLLGKKRMSAPSPSRTSAEVGAREACDTFLHCRAGADAGAEALAINCHVPAVVLDTPTTATPSRVSASTSLTEVRSALTGVPALFVGSTSSAIPARVAGLVGAANTGRSLSGCTVTMVVAAAALAPSPAPKRPPSDTCTVTFTSPTKSSGVSSLSVLSAALTLATRPCSESCGPAPALEEPVHTLPTSVVTVTLTPPATSASRSNTDTPPSLMLKGTMSSSTTRVGGACASGPLFTGSTSTVP